MKKRNNERIGVRLRLLALLLATMSLFILASCDSSTNGQTPLDPDDYVFTQDVEAVLIFADDVTTDSQKSIYQSLKDAMGKAPAYYYDDSEPEGHEIIIGKSTRPVSQKAYRKLRTVNKSSDEYLGYVIYASGNSVAIAYDEDYDNLAVDRAVEYFVNNYIVGRTELKFNPGVVYEGIFRPLDTYAEIDSAKKAAAWAKLEAAIGGEVGTEIVEAFKEFYSIYDSKVATWFANLYDPFICHCGECVPGSITSGAVSCGGGGFYYSNSGRDNEGYAADIESTAQLLNMLTSSGMADLDGGNYKHMIPETMRNQIIVYLRSLQDSNGFFYNYQWTKEATDAQTLPRRARDLGSAVSVLKAFGSGPKYDTPNGDKGIGSVTTPLGTSTPTVAAMTVLVAEESPYDPRFESVDSLLAYLNSLLQAYPSGDSRFYAIGSVITSQMQQVVNRDADLGFSKANGNFAAEGSLTHCIVEWFNSYQRSDNGLWGPSSYAGINGLLKISGIYLKAEVPMNYAKEAALAAVDALTSSEKAGSAVNVYNAWYSISNVLRNLRTAGKNDVADEVRTALYAVAPEAIRMSAEKTLPFKKPDGSFSYGIQYSSATSQGMPVAVPNSAEGDVNGTALNMTGLIANIYDALEISSGHRVRLFGTVERRMFLDEIYKLGPVQKIAEEVGVNDYPFDFEDADLDQPHPDVAAKLNSNGSSANVIKDPFESGHGQILKFVSNPGGGDYVYAKNNGQKTNSCYTFEADIMVDKSTMNTYFSQIFVGNFYMLSLRKQSDQRLQIFESTTGDANTAIYNDIAFVNIGEWFNLRVEFYRGDADTVRIKVYVNDTLRIISDNYFGKTKQGAEPPINDSSYDNTGIYIMSGANSLMYIDNLYATSTKDAYVGATDEDTDVIYNVDNIAPPSGGDGSDSGDGTTPTPTPTPIGSKVDFEGEILGDAPISVTVGTISPGSSAEIVKRGEDGKALLLSSYPGGGDYIDVVNTSGETGCYIFETDIKIGADTTNSHVVQIFLGSAYLMGFTKSGSSITVYEVTLGDYKDAIKNDLATFSPDEWINIRIEYYRATKASDVRIKTYINGALVSVSNNYYGKLPSGTSPAPNDTGYAKTQVYVMSGAVAFVTVDNIHSTASSQKYTPATADENPIYNVDK